MMIHYHPTLPRIDASGECGMHLDLVHWRGMGSAKVGVNKHNDATVGVLF